MQRNTDVDPTFTILIALTTPTKDEDTVSKAYGVKIISPMGSHTIGKQIVELVDSQLQQPKLEEAKAEAKVEPNPSPKPEPAMELKQATESPTKESESAQEVKQHKESATKSEEQEREAQEELEETRRTTVNDMGSDEEQAPESAQGTNSAEHSHNDWDSESF